MTNYITKTIKNGVEANIPVTSVNGQYGDVTIQSSGGDVVGPSSSTNGDIALFDGTTGKLIKDSGVVLSSKANTSDVLTKTNTTSYTPTANYHPATKKYVDDNIKTYNAGHGIEIGNDYSAMQGPCPDGYHIPFTSEWTAVKTVWTTLGGGSSDGTNFGTALKLPFAGRRNETSSNVSLQGSSGFYWCSNSGSSVGANYFTFTSSSISTSDNRRSFGFSIRCFKDSPVIPTSSWTKLYGTSIEAGGIFWNSAEGLISMSSNGTTWITITDKNLGATQVWNNGDTLSESNCGKYYQWGNNYGFPRTGTLTDTSTTQVDANNYGPGNYYSSSTFIIRSSTPYDWSSVQNDNLWGGVTGVISNTIFNTGALSVNGQTGDVTIESGRAKIFTLSSTSDLTNAQAAFDWVKGASNIAYIRLSGSVKLYRCYGSNYITTFTGNVSFQNVYPSWNTVNFNINKINLSSVVFQVSSGAVTSVTELTTLSQAVVSSLPANPDANTIYFVTD